MCAPFLFHLENPRRKCECQTIQMKNRKSQVKIYEHWKLTLVTCDLGYCSLAASLALPRVQLCRANFRLCKIVTNNRKICLTPIRCSNQLEFAFWISFLRTGWSNEDRESNYTIQAKTSEMLIDPGTWYKGAEVKIILYTYTAWSKKLLQYKLTFS